MNADKCKTCKYCHVFYIGTKEEPKFSEPSCHWAWKYCKDIKECECHYREDSTRRV